MKSIWLAAASPAEFASTSFAQPAAQPPTSNLDKVRTFQSTSPLPLTPRPGARRSPSFKACHGLDGFSKYPEAPNLAGQIQGYLVKALTDYKFGERKNETMNIVANDLSEQDMTDIRAYCSSIQVDVLPP
ncbi:MAG TPA: hypothetical protein VEZ24_13295 [Microvirga sp.]|nr:hypothetical protein [Microvirga sp.]